MKKLIEQHYLDNHKRMVKLLSNRAGTPQNAEDVVQDAFENALRYGNSFNPAIQEFGAWFNSILNNALRKFKVKEKLLGMSVEFMEELSSPVDMLDWEDDMIKSVRADINSRGNLELRQVLYLYFFKGYKPREIVCVTDLSNGYIRVSVHEFKQFMKVKYGGVL